MKKYFINNALFRVIAPVIFGVLIYLLVLLINNDVRQVNALFLSEEVYVFIATTYLSFESSRLMIILLNKFYSGLNENLRFIAQVIITVSASVFLVMFAFKLYFNYVVGFSMSSLQLSIFASLFTVTAILYNILYFSNYYLHRENTTKLNSEKQQRQVLELEMMEFKNDINPDLLYESLESLIAIMYRDVEKAEDYIDCLASSYRYVLSNRQKELVPLAQEVQAARNIVKLLNEKYNDQLILNISPELGAEDVHLIPGSLPLVIETVVRNSIISRFEPFVISCYREDDYITLQTKLNDKLILHKASQHAFTRLQRSYALYTELPLIRVKAYDENYIKLPVVNVSEEVEA
jgi:sensor histidine kinase YesM